MNEGYLFSNCYVLVQLRTNFKQNQIRRKAKEKRKKKLHIYFKNPLQYFSHFARLQPKKCFIMINQKS